MFWHGTFGDDYIERNKSEQLLAAKLALFADVFKTAEKVDSAAEFGCNIGLNLRAINLLLPEAQLSGIEINEKAVAQLQAAMPKVNVQRQSIVDEVDAPSDLTFTVGVLIHIHPDNLPKVYENLYRNSKRYILVAEYYNPTPVSLPYRGHDDKLFKRDFAGDLMAAYNDLRLVDHGFCYHKDTKFPQDDISWFLLEKRS